jgi:hypothetical protein
MHYPQTLKEVTSLIPKTAITVLDQTVTVDLSTLDLGLGLGAGVIPSTYTIYVRAHAIYDSNVYNVPADNSLYTFGTRATAELPGIGPIANESSQIITALQACVNGNIN